jgi:hypothetical protein
VRLDVRECVRVTFPTIQIQHDDAQIGKRKRNMTPIPCIHTFNRLRCEVCPEVTLQQRRMPCRERSKLIVEALEKRISVCAALRVNPCELPSKIA